MKKQTKLKKQNASCDLLIIGEMSCSTSVRAIFNVIVDRSERKRIITSTNLPSLEWMTMFENPTMAATMIDNLTYRSYVLNINSEKPYRAEFAAKHE